VNRLETMGTNDREREEFTAIIDKETERLSELTGKLMSATKETDERRGRILSIHSVIRDAIELLPKPPSGSMGIKTFFNARPDTVRGNLAQIHQVFLNLLVNAVESMPDGGELTIVTGNSVFEIPYNIAENSVKPGRYVWGSVKDSGRTLSDHEVKNIFRPFLKAGRAGAGMGLGLSLVQRLVTKHDGFIHVESEEGEGTTFTLYLPEELPLDESKSRKKQLPRGDETILVVDDEPHIRTVLNSMLGYLGYEVLLASNGAEAIEILRCNETSVDLVLLDIIMPEMGGEEAYRNIKNISPAVKVVLSTGYARDQVLSDLLQKGADALVRKPYAVGTISQVIRDTLDSKE
ncbi:MAG TPA: response regulator, partial [candidate division Zixibacteria bacterium]|nr:response regulator [candidate division Zixibacteria bacterium]